MHTEQTLSKKQFILRWHIVCQLPDFSLEQKIIECQPESIVSVNGTAFPHMLDDICKLFESDRDMFLFIHKNKNIFEPLFCIVCNNTKSDQSELQKFCISEKFALDFLKNNAIENKFLNVLYSKENINRLKRHDLDIYDIEHYYY